MQPIMYFWQRQAPEFPPARLSFSMTTLASAGEWLEPPYAFGISAESLGESAGGVQRLPVTLVELGNDLMDAVAEIGKFML